MRTPQWLQWCAAAALLLAAVGVAVAARTTIQVHDDAPVAIAVREGPVRDSVSVHSGAGGEWNETLAYILVEYASAAYCDRQQIQSWSCKACGGNTTGFVVSDYILDVKSSTNAFVGYNTRDRMIILCFEGSANITNWLHDLEFIKVDFKFPNAPKGVRVHAGFYHAYNSVSTQCVTAVLALVELFPDYAVYVVGHSLGGALSVFGALDLTVNAKLSPTVYTYGEPRVGNEDFAKFFDQFVGASMRVVNNSDIFPSLPPRILGYYHVATEVWYHDGKVVVCNGGEDPDCSDSQVNLSTQDHHVYLGNLMGGDGC